MEISQLDESLARTIEYLKQEWMSPEVGIVACAVIGANGKEVISTSIYVGNGRFRHAEKSAITKWRNWFQNEPIEAAVVSASPCASEKSTLRDGPSCVTVLHQEGVSRVHFGVLDVHQISSLDGYDQLGLDATVTADPELSEICRALINLFGEFKGRRGHGKNPWPQIKKQIQPRPFS